MVAAIDYARVARTSAAVQEQAGNLRSELARIRTNDFPNDDVKALIEVLTAACSELSVRTADVQETAGLSQNNAALLERAFKLLGRYNQVVRLLHVFLGFLRDADVYTLPNTLSGLLRKKLAALDKDANVYMHADDQYNYYYLPLGQVLKGALGSVGLTVGVNEKLAVVAFPKSESGSTLKCTLLAHEIGHYVYEALQLDASAAQQAKAADDWSRAEACLTTLFIDAKEQIHIDQQRMSQYWSIVLSWLQELAADRIAVHLLGPAFAIAWLDYTVAMEERDVSKTHPSPANRVDVLWTWLTDESNPWTDVVVGRVGPRVPWIHSIRSEANLANANAEAPVDDQEAVRGVVKLLLPHVAAAVDAAFPADNLSRQALDFSEKADAAFDLLNKGVPPGEVLVGAKLTPLLDSTALLAGWMFLLDGLDAAWGAMVESVETESTHHAMSCLLDEHVAKAIEIIALRLSWDVVL